MTRFIDPAKITPRQTFHRADTEPGSIFGRHIYRLRLERDIRQADLASDIGMSQSQLSRIEHGTSMVDLHTIYMLALRFGVQPSDLLRGAGL